MNPQMTEINNPNNDANSVVSVGDFNSTDQNLNEAVNKKPTEGPKKSILAVLLAIIIILSVLATYLLFFLDKSVSTSGANGKNIKIPNTPSSVESQFMNDIFENNLHGAYGLTSTKFKASTNEASFAKLEKYLAVNKLSTQGLKTTTKGKYIFIYGNIDAGNVHIFNFSTRMLKQSGYWRVDNIVVQS